MPKVQLQDLELLWSFKASDLFRTEFSSLNLTYENLNEIERDQAILKVLNSLDADLVKVGAHRANDWERGWGENFQNYKESKNLEDVIPKYFNKIPYVRWKQNWIKPSSPTMEYDMLGLIVNYVTETHLQGFDDIYEFGCGTGHNLLRMRKRLPSTNLHGLDWATSSQKLITEIAMELKDSKLFAENFNYFEPNPEVEISDNSAVITVASLEQTGTNFVDFISFLVEKKPKLVIHIEPMWEPLDRDNLLDVLSIKYFEKRQYLNGLQQHIENLEKENKVSVVDKKRSYIGSFFIDGYSILIWKPV